VRDEAYPGGPDERLPGPLGWSGGRQTRRRYRSPPVSHERAILPPILMIVFVDTLGYAAVVPLIPLVLSGQGAPLLAVGTVFAAFSLCQLLTAPLLGRLSDRVGRRPVLAFSLAGSVAGFALLAISSAFPVVLLSRIIDGCSAGNVAMCYAAVLDSDSEDKRRRAIPALGAAAGAGIVAGLGLSAFLAGFGFRAVALAAMLLSLLCLALTLIAVPETRRRTSPGLKISAALRIREVQRAVVFVALCAALQAAFLLTLPVYFASALGLSVQATTALIALIVLAAAAFQVVALPRLLRRVGVATTAGLVLAVALCAAAFVEMIAGGAAAIVVLSAAVLTVAAAALAPISTLFLAESHPDASGGVAMGLNTSFATIGQIVGPLIGYAAFASGGSQVLGLSCVALALCCAVTLGMGRWLKIERAPDR
jgi:DHA1 family tetracycline resistance protein-like MFS transporter